jgi:hypothetical protein
MKNSYSKRDSISKQREKLLSAAFKVTESIRFFCQEFFLFQNQSLVWLEMIKN